MADIGKMIGAVTREVRDREYEGKPAKVVVATRRYSTTIDDLWDALTNPVRIPRWFMPISGDLRLGGRYQLQGNAGGTITRCDPPTRLDATWEFGGQVSWIEVTLTADATGGTMLRLEHTAHVPPEFWDQYGPGAVGVGWDMGLFGLQQHVEAGGTVSPENAAAWLVSPEGLAMVTQCSEAWGKATIAAGVDPVAVQGMVARTTAFYTGAPAPSS